MRRERLQRHPKQRLDNPTEGKVLVELLDKLEAIRIKLRQQDDDIELLRNRVRGLENTRL